MNFTNRSLPVIVAFTLLLTVMVTGPAVAADGVQHLVQMPVAVDKTAEAGVPAAEVNRLTEALNRAEVDPVEFNETLRNVPEFAARTGSVTTIGDFVVARVEDGLRGEELANAIHQRLREEGIPARGRDSAGPPPIAEDFMPADARDNVEKARSNRTMERNRRDRDIRDRRRQQRPSTGAGAGAGQGTAGPGTNPSGGAGR